MRFVCFALLIVTNFCWAQLSPGDLSRYHAKLEGLNNCTQCHELGEEVTSAKCLTCHTAIKERIDSGKGYHSSPEVKAERCAKCHGEHFGREFELVYWKDGAEKFDHGKTGWPLAGAHAKQKCSACHGNLKAYSNAEVLNRLGPNTNQERTHLGLLTDCASCHADEHGDQLPNNCEQCHNAEKWTPAPSFSHDKSKFPLTGKHANVECAKCHKSEPDPSVASTVLLVDKAHPTERTRFTGLEFTSCASCHKDAHEGKFGPNCSGCHTTENFAVAQMAKDFVHNKTGFPLTGKHIGRDCIKCHTSGKMTDPVAHAACKDCHKDEHRGQFTSRADGGACETCHDVNGFIPAHYGIAEHAQSKFPLAGGHLATPCIACHAQTLSDRAGEYAMFAFTDHACKSCHADIHRGQLDKYMQTSGCDYCHNVESWRKITFDHAKTGFPLVGKHDQNECMTCHVREHQGTPEEQIKMAPLARECELCHKDPHRAQFTLAQSDPVAPDVKIKCGRCHTPDAWKTLVFDHSRDARWALDGAHQKVACNLCHKPQTDTDGTFTLYRPLPFACSDCHGGTLPEKQ